MPTKDLSRASVAEGTGETSGERETIRAAKTGDRRAIERLLLSCRPVIRREVAGQRPILGDRSDLVEEDLYQEGCEGVLLALDRYDFSKACGSFKNYAFYWIKTRVRTAARVSCRPESVSPSFARDFSRFKSLQAAEGTPSLLAGVKTGAHMAALRAYDGRPRPVSLEAVPEDGEGLPLSERISGLPEEEPEDRYRGGRDEENVEIVGREVVREVIRELPTLQRETLCRAYGLESGDPEPREHIAAELNLGERELHTTQRQAEAVVGERLAPLYLGLSTEKTPDHSEGSRALAASA